MKRKPSLYLCAVLALNLAAAAMLASCGSGESDGSADGSGTELQAPETEPEAVLRIIEGSASAYKVIFPADNSACARLAEKFCDNAKSGFGVRPDYSSDFLLPGREPSEYEILIGPTSRKESRSVLSSLNSGEYAVTVIGNKLVICGSTDDATENAMAYFMRIFFGGDGSFALSDCKDVKLTYRITSCLICGEKLEKLKIVIPKGSGSAEYFAGMLRDTVAGLTGKQLEITDSDVPGIAIRFGNYPDGVKAAAGEYLIEVTEKGLCVCASGNSGLYDAYTALEKQVFSGAQSELVLEKGQRWSGKLTEQTAPSKSAGIIRVMYHNVWGYQSEYPVLGRGNMGCDVYREYSPDVLCMQEAGPLYRSGANAFYNGLSAEGYAEICFPDLGGQGNPIYYRKDLLEAVDSGYSKSRTGDKGTTWAVFRVKTGENAGKKFGLTNSHFAANSNAGGDAGLGDKYRTEDAKCCAEAAGAIAAKYPGIAVVMGGDYNCAKGSAPYAAILASSAVHVRDTLSCWDIQSPFHSSFGYERSTGRYELQSALRWSGSESIDHIFILGESVSPVSYTVVRTRLALTCSDHAPHFTDIKFN